MNGIEIARDAIAAETQHHPAAKPIEAIEAAARALVIRQLLIQEAQSRCILPAPETDGMGRRETDEEALVRQLAEQAVTVAEPTDEECLRYYEANGGRYRTADLHEVDHILVAADPADPAARVAAAKQAKTLAAALQSAPESFERLAREQSACPSGASGGRLGQIGPGQTVPEFETALSGLPVGRIAPEPLESRFGYHIVRVSRRIDGRALPYDFVRERILSVLRARAHAVAIRAFISGLVGKAKISGIDMLQSERSSAKGV